MAGTRSSEEGKTMTSRIRWERMGGSCWIGRVSEIDADLFEIWENAAHAPAAWRLKSALPGQQPGRDARSRWHLYRDDPDELKAEAERWLEEFTSSLGASFQWSELRDQITRDAAIEQELGDDYSESSGDLSWDSANQHWGRAEALREVLALMARMEAGQ